MRRLCLLVVAFSVFCLVAASNAQALVLSWQDNSNNETGFAIEMLKGGTWTEVARVAADVVAFTDTNTEGVYRVRAFITVDGHDVFSGYSNTGAMLKAPVNLTVKP